MHFFKYLIIPTFIGIFLSLGTLDAKVATFNICHVDEETGVAKLLSLPSKAFDNHQSKHADDAEPGGTSDSGITYDAECVPVIDEEPEFVFIRVYRENGTLENGGDLDDYDGLDSLYVEVVDTSEAKGTLGAGDTIKVHLLPTDFDASTTTVDVGEHIVASFSLTPPTTTIELVSTSGQLFRFTNGLGEQRYREGPGPSISTTTLLDLYSTSSPNDFIQMVTGSPSQPNSFALKQLEGAGATDDPWLQIKFYEPESET